MPKTEKEHVAKLIRREVSFFNGWWVEEETVQKACEKAAKKVLRYLRARAIRESGETK